MRIVSPFKDYYDVVHSHGDDVPLFIRKTREVDLDKGSVFNGKKNNPAAEILTPVRKIVKNMPIFDGHHNGVIVFCGKVYPFYQTNRAFLQKATFFDINKIIEAYPDRKYLHEQKHTSWRWSNPRLNLSSWDIFKKNYFPERISDDVFRYFDSPIILIVSNTCEINPRLNQYNFATQVDPFTAFQELSMFIGNNLVKQVDQEPKGINDSLKRDYHGFDKWSFKKR